MTRGTRAVAETLGAFLVVFALELAAPIVGLGGTAFALALPLAVGVAILTGGPGVALTAHVVGFVLGLGSGRLHLLRAG